MRKLVKTEIAIDASPAAVWRELTDFASFPGWNPFIRKASGSLEPGAQLDIALRVTPGPLMRFKPRVQTVVPERELRWLAQQGRPGVFDVVRSFVIEPREDGGVVFVQSEVCTGVLTPLMFAVPLERWLYQGYDRFNEAIRARAEAAEVAVPSPVNGAPALVAH